MQIVKYIILFFIIVISTLIGKLMAKKYVHRLEELEVNCKTILGTKKDKKNFNKLLKQTNKTYSILSKSYKLILNQKIQMPEDFLDIGLDIDKMGEELSNFKEF